MPMNMPMSAHCAQALVLDHEYESSTLIFPCRLEDGHPGSHFDGSHVHWTDRA